jgi:hypothetical protein
MRVSRYQVLTLLLVLCGSCIEPFNPVIEERQEVLVINGFITDRGGPHQVLITRSTPYNDPSNIPVSGCVVTVEDETGIRFEYSEIYPGVYEAILMQAFVQVGKSYSLYVNTPDGNEYRSDFEEMLACSPVDSIYYEVKERPTSDPDVVLNGVQFYVDVRGSTETAPNYRWLLEETWMYNAPHYADLLYDGNYLYDIQSPYYCFRTDTAKGLYTASTHNLSVNHLNRQSLHYVSNQTPRLSLKYSILVEQHSLSDPAYDFWKRMESQTTEGEGLYEAQPSSTIGNIYNVDDPTERVLGYFYATQVQQKRLTLVNDFDFGIKLYQCPLDTIQDLSELGEPFPYYLTSLDPTGMRGPPYMTGSKKCFDCRMWGGTTEEPDF